MKFDAKELSDQELVVLESTLRVQLAVTKYVRVQQITSAIGSALLTAGLSTLLSGPSIVCSTVLRKKCKRRYFATRRELFLRRIEVAPIQESVFAKRALALSIASGLTCCVLGVALDVLVDGAVLQVVAFFFGTAFEDHVTGRTTGFVHDNAAELVGRDQVYVIDEAPFTLFGTKGDPTAGAVADTNETTKTKTKSSKLRAKSLMDISRHFWKSASWSFSSAEMQEKIKNAKQKYRQRPSMHGSFNRSLSEKQDDDDTNNNRRSASDNWAFLFAQDHHEFRADTGTDTTDGEEREHETLFGCRMRATTTLFGTNLDEFGTEEEGEQVELVRSDTFALFGDCYIVRVRHASTIVSPRPQASLLETKRASEDHYEDLFTSEPATDDLVYGNVGGDTTVVHVIPCGEEDLSTGVIPDRPHQHYEKSLVFTGDEASCAFWDGIWHLDDDDLGGDLGGDDQGDVEYGVEVWGFDDEEEDVKLYHHHASLEPEYSVEVWNYDDEEDDDGTSLFPRAPLSPPYPNYKHTIAVDEEIPHDAFSLFGSPHERLDSVSTIKYHPQHLNEEEVDDLRPEGLFG